MKQCFQEFSQVRLYARHPWFFGVGGIVAYTTLACAFGILPILPERVLLA